MKTKANKGIGNKILKIFLGLVVAFLAISILTTILYRWVNPPITLTMISRAIFDGEKIDKKWIDIDEISPYMAQAAVAAEDNCFLGHHGFDVVALDKVLEEHKNGKKLRGGSGISQQTAKNVFLWQHQSWIRKGLEVYYTALIEIFWSKERIMEVYLNVIEMGHGIYGAEAAAKNYFHSSAKKLSKHQCALITVCYPNPRKFNAGKPSAYIQKRASAIENLMNKIGKIEYDRESIKKAQERFKKHKKEYFEQKKHKKG